MPPEVIIKAEEAPSENFSRGLLEVNIPELGEKIKGKNRDIWVFGNKRVMVSTDRQSAYDRMICTVPGKGQVLNLLSKFWFENTRHIIPNHFIAVPHPNALIARQAIETLPVELVLRRYMAKSATETSIYYNYFSKGRREIYGRNFPRGMKPNQEFERTIITPTTKSHAHDEELSPEKACSLVDSKLGKGNWKKASTAAKRLFEVGQQYHAAIGLILVDTKFEFGIDKNGELMLIDEIFTPDSSRFWLKSSYQERFEMGEDPENFDKEILRKWLAEHNFKGDGPVPIVDTEIINRMSVAYRVPYTMVTGKDVAEQRDPYQESIAVAQSIISYFSNE